MSHIVSIRTKLLDATAIAAACQRLGLEPPVTGTAELFSQTATGLIVNLPGWHYPAVIDTASGTVQYDTYEGRWGNQAELDRLLQAYAVEKARAEARRTGNTVTEQTLADGSIKLTIQVGGVMGGAA